MFAVHPICVQDSIFKMSSESSAGANELTHCRLVTAYGTTDLVNTGLGDDFLLLDDTKPSCKPALTNHQ